MTKQTTSVIKLTQAEVAAAVEHYINLMKASSDPAVKLSGEIKTDWCQAEQFAFTILEEASPSKDLRCCHENNPDPH